MKAAGIFAITPELRAKEMGEPVGLGEQRSLLLHDFLVLEALYTFPWLQLLLFPFCKQLRPFGPVTV